MKLSTWPPTSGMFTRTVVLKSSRAPVPTGTSDTVADRGHRRSRHLHRDRATRRAVADRVPGFGAGHLEIAGNQSGDHFRQPIREKADRQSRRHGSARVDGQPIQGRGAAVECGQPRLPVVLVGERRQDFVDGDGSVE